MATTQLNVRVPVELAEQLRQAAQQQGRGVGTIVTQAITAHLAGASSPAPAAPANISGLVGRVSRIEQRLLALEQAGPSSSSPAPAPAPPPVYSGPIPDGPITTSELADLLDMKRGTLNARITRASGGGAVVGLEVLGWRCVSLKVPERGGPAQALWELVGCS